MIASLVSPLVPGRLLRRLAPSLAAMMMLAGCEAGPNFLRPAAPSVSGYAAPGDKDLASADKVADAQQVALGEKIGGDWWNLFHSPALDGVVKQAIAGSPTLAAARSTLIAANDMTAAANGGMLPQVSVNGTIDRERFNYAQNGINFPTAEFTLYQVGASASYNFDIAGGEKRQVEQAAAQAQSDGYQLDAAFMTITGQITMQALTIASLTDQIQAISDITGDDQRNLDLVQQAKSAGSATSVDLLTASSQLARDRTLLPPLQQRLGVARHALAVLVGKAPSDWTPPDFSLAALALPQDVPLSLPSELVRQRPDILAAEANLHAASAAIGVVAAEKYPSINLVATLAQGAVIPANLFKFASTGASLGPTVSLPIFNGGTVDAKQKAAEATYQADLANYQETVLQAFRQVADQLDALTHDQDELAAQDKALSAAADGLRLTRLSYSAGNTGVLQVLDSERLYQQAQIGHVQAVAQRYLDTAQLFVAMGGGWWNWSGRAGDPETASVQGASTATP